MAKEPEDKSMESWIWDAACSIHGAVDAPKYKDFILPLIFVKRLCDVFDDEINRIAAEVGSREKAFKLVEHDKKLVRFYIPLKSKHAEEPVWTAIRKLTAKIGETLTTHLRAVAKENQLLSGIIDRVDFNATTHGVRDIDDDRLSNLIEEVSKKRLGLNDVEPDIIGRSYEYLIRKFAEGGGQSAGEFYTPKEVGMIMAKIMDPGPGMTIYDPCCGSAGLLIKCELALDEKMKAQGRKKFSGLTLYGQEYIAQTWAMANMNMIIHDMEGQIEIGDTFRNPKFRDNNRLMTFDRVVANPMWNQTMFGEKDYDADAFGRFPNGAGYPGNKADWGWMQHIFASLNDKGKAAVVFGTGSASRGSGDNSDGIEKNVRKYFVDRDLVEAVILLPFNLFYNTDAPGLIYILNKEKVNERKNKVLFINISESFIKGKPKNILSPEGADKVIDIYFKFEEEHTYSKILKLGSIKDSDYYLTPSRYVLKTKNIQYLKFSEAKNIYKYSLKDFLARAASIYNKIDSINIINENINVECEYGLTNKECTLIPLSELVEEYDFRAEGRSYDVLSCSKIYGIIMQNEKFNNNIASSNTSRYKVIEPSMFAYDPMLLWDGSIGCNHYSKPGIVSPAYTVFKVVANNLSIDYLEFILRSKFMIPFYTSISDGTNMRRRKAKFHEFQKLRIPVFNKEIQEDITNLLRFKKEQEGLIKSSTNFMESFFYSSFFGV